ncbi:MAG: iron hydrogenase small subunit, partial [Janthinobacterium sp.]
DKRMRAIYELDKQAVRHSAHENRAVQTWYATEMQEANAVQARVLLHTSYAARNSRRLLLMQFLDCVDRRDGAGAATLLHPDASWSTASPFGDVHGATAIQALIDTRLPAREYGPAFARHRMVSAADMDDLAVITPTGELCRFSVALDSSRSPMLISRLVRTILPG